MANIHDHEQSLKDTQRALKRADKLITDILAKGHPSCLNELAVSTANLRERLLEEIDKMQNLNGYRE